MKRLFSFLCVLLLLGYMGPFGVQLNAYKRDGGYLTFHSLRWIHTREVVASM